METTFYVLIWLFVALYVSQSLLILLGSHRLTYTQTQTLPSISILVALRDEERTVRTCLESLLKLDYPQELLEIVLINDRSCDRTLDIITEAGKASSQITVIDIKSGIRGLSGKANAIAQGMAHCTGEIILVTDGDCRVPTGWARAHVAYYTENVGLVGGFTLLDEKGTRARLFEKIQSLDWGYLLSIGSGAIGLGMPLSILGNNFSFRRAAYEEVGGYRNMGFTIIEDFALMKTLLKKTTWEVRYPIDPQMVVFSHPMANLRNFYKQRKRWSAGGKEVGWYGKFLMFVSHFVHLLLPLSLLVLTAEIVAMGVVFILVADLILLNKSLGIIKRRDLLRYFLPWELFYFCYTSLFAPVLLLPTTVEWKRISYSWKLDFSLKNMAERQ